jgi:hypothetical protein
MARTRAAIPVCVDCGSPVSAAPVKRCRTCAAAYQRNRARPDVERTPNPVRIEGAVARLGMTNRDGEVIAEAIVDVTDLERVQARRWCLSSGWARSSETRQGKVRQVFLHRYLLGLDTGHPARVVHLNGDRLDNRRENLRTLSSREPAVR